MYQTVCRSRFWYENPRLVLPAVWERTSQTIEAAVFRGDRKDVGGRLPVPVFAVQRTILDQRLAVLPINDCEVSEVSPERPDRLAREVLSTELLATTSVHSWGAPVPLRGLPL